MAIIIAENMAEWIKESLPADQVCEYIGFCDPVDMENGNVADRVIKGFAPMAARAVANMLV